MITGSSDAPRWGGDRHIPAAQYRSTIPMPERAQALQVRYHRLADLPNLGDCLNLQFRQQLFGLDGAIGVFTEGAAEIFEAGALHLQPRGHLVATITFEVTAARFERAGQMKARDASPAAL